jgi:branched-chain amino acid transport system ATP-binding protein/urea transport system ATP-binding protein
VLDQGQILQTGSVQHVQSCPKVQEVYLRRA